MILLNTLIIIYLYDSFFISKSLQINKKSKIFFMVFDEWSLNEGIA